MQFVHAIRHYVGCDVGYTSSNMHPENGEHRVGRSGIDKNLSFEDVLRLARTMQPRPNVIVKGGQNAKWYMKRFLEEEIETQIQKQRWRDTSRVDMYVITWLDET